MLKKNDWKASERHRTSLETIVTAVNALKEFVNGADEKKQFKHGVAELKKL